MDDRDSLRFLLLGNDGQPIRWPWPDRPPTPHGRKLMEALGVVGMPEARVSSYAPSFVPVYCPHRGCQWSSRRGGTAGTRDLATHIEVVHKGDDPRAQAIERITAANGHSEGTIQPPTSPDTAPAQVVEATQEGTTSARRPGRKPDGTTWSRKKLTRGEAIEELTAALDELDAVPSRTGWQNLRRRPSMATLDRLFGSWGAAVEACGFTPPPAGTQPKSWTRERIIAAFQAFNEREGRPPNSGDVNGNPALPSVNAVKRIFGNWTPVYEAAGLTPADRVGRKGSRLGRPKVTREEALAALQAAAAELGQPPSSKEWKRSKRAPGQNVFYKLFGTWSAALEAAGLDATASQPTRAKQAEKIHENIHGPVAVAPSIPAAKPEAPTLGPSALGRALIALARIEGIATATQMNYLRCSDEMAAVLRLARAGLEGSP